MNCVVLNKKARRQLKKIPNYIRGKLITWMKDVEEHGIAEIRRVPGYHDEPLGHPRKGQRSIRLSEAYRAFYVERKDKIVIEVIEVNKHDY
jgi:proteic killer suppression protein